VRKKFLENVISPRLRRLYTRLAVAWANEQERQVGHPWHADCIAKGGCRAARRSLRSWAAVETRPLGDVRRPSGLHMSAFIVSARLQICIVVKVFYLVKIKNRPQTSRAA
jgi:hypothetical protein